MRIWKRPWALLLILCLFLAGCGAGSKTGADGTENPGADGRENTGTDRETDRKADAAVEGGGAGTAAPGSLTAPGAAVLTGDKLYLKSRQSAAFYGPEEGYQEVGSFYDVSDGKIYLFRAETPIPETGGRKGLRICVQTFDSSTRDIDQYFLTPEIPGHEEYTVSSVGLTSDGDISLKLEDPDGGGNAFLVRTDLQGSILETKDPFPDEEKYPWNIDAFSGKRIFHLTDGRTLLSEFDMTTFGSTVTWLDGQDFTQIQQGILEAVCCDGDGSLYCLTNGCLLRLDSQGNILNELLRLNEIGVEYRDQSALFLIDGGMLLCCIGRDKISIYELTDQKITNDEEIRIACLEGTVGVDYILRTAVDFSYDAEGIPVNIETAEDETYQEDYRNRIMAEMTAGKGPDMLLLTRDEAALLAEKGYLDDLSDLIPEDTRAAMIPSVLELGTLYGKLAAITPQVEFSTMITGDRTWKKDSWNIFEFKELVESRDDLEIPVSYFDRNLSFYSLYWWMFGDSMANSPLLDLEQGISHLDSEEYVEILELCRKYSDKTVSLSGSEADAMLKEGKIAARRINIYRLADFSTVMNRYADGFHFVGPPSESGAISCVEAYSFQYLAVNANSPHKEEIRKFLAFLLDYDRQYTVDGCSVRTDVIRDSVVKGPAGLDGYVVLNSSDPENFSITILEDLKPDGTPWLEEFLDFVNNSMPPPDLPAELSGIIGSELVSYYEEGRSAEETAGNIHNRVQLYLDERK